MVYVYLILLLWYHLISHWTINSSSIDVSGEVKVKMADPCIYTANGGIEDSTNEEVTVQSCDNHVQVYFQV